MIAPHVTIAWLACFLSTAGPAAAVPDAHATTPSALVSPKTPGDHAQTIASGGLERHYIVHVPAGYDGRKPMPLVLVLHGAGGSAKSMIALTGWNAKADRVGAIVVYLQGTAGERTGWNTGFTPQLGITADDVQLVRDVIGKLGEQLAVDADRVYAAGFSNGGIMAHRLAAELPKLLAGVAVVEGTVGARPIEGGAFTDIPTPRGPIPVVMLHGKLDAVVPYAGGGHKDLALRAVAYAVKLWTHADKCGAKPTVTTRPDHEVIVSDYTACAQGSEVLLYTLVHGEHQWPTAGNAAKLSATDEIWKFFARHHH
jgi:polyhydroxybutyrate depolymerase